MKKFTINCDFGGQLSPFTIFIGKPERNHHPLHFQADWLSKARGGMIPGEVMEAVTQLQELAEKNNVSLEELCVYALGTDEQKAELEAEDEDFDDEDEYDDENSEDDQDEDDNSSIDDEGQPDERHDVKDTHEHDVVEAVEDMASEGGHIEEDTPDSTELEEKK